MKSFQPSKALLLALPKNDLHVHLDGSLRLPTLIELAREQGVRLPSYEIQGLRELVFKEHYADLTEYLQGFQYTCAVMRDAESLERIAYELAWDNFNEGVRYIEPRFAPQLHASPQLSLESVLLAVDRGLKRAQQEINLTAEILSGKAPPFRYAMIGCALRKFSADFSPYYEKFTACHQYTPPQRLYPLASLELVRALVNIRDQHGIPITGFDLAGEEKGWPANAHWEAFHFAQQHFLKKTVHAGEAYGPSSIFQAINECYANRIGHGTHLFASHLVENIPQEKQEKFTEDLAEYLSSRRITLEICLTSNQQTIPALRNLNQHPLKKMLQRRMSVSLCTDNRLVSNTTVTEEILKALEHFSLSAQELKNIILYGFKRSFSALAYTEKREYVRQVIDYYEQVEKHFALKKPEELP